MAAQAKASAPEIRKEKEKETVIVEPGVLLRGMLPVVAFAALSAALLIGLVFYPLQKSIAGEPDLRIRAILQAHIMEIHLRLWPLLVVAGLVAAYLAYYRALRMARPVYRVHYAVRAVLEGDYKVAPFPRREEFRFLQDDLSQINQKMKLIAGRNRDILLSVHTYVEKLAHRVESGEIVPRADLEEVLGAIRAQLQKAPEVGLLRR